MYSREQRDKAVGLFIKYDLSVALVMRELGYPCHRTLWKWHGQYLEEQKTGIVRDLQGGYGRYTEEQRAIAVRYYLEHGRSLRKTVRAVGYPSHTYLAQWLDELAPGEKRRFERPCYTEEQKREAAIALVTRHLVGCQDSEGDRMRARDAVCLEERDLGKGCALQDEHRRRTSR